MCVTHTLRDFTTYTTLQVESSGESHQLRGEARRERSCQNGVRSELCPSASTHTPNNETIQHI